MLIKRSWKQLRAKQQQKYHVHAYFRLDAVAPVELNPHAPVSTRFGPPRMKCGCRHGVTADGAFEKNNETPGLYATLVIHVRRVLRIEVHRIFS